MVSPQVTSLPVPRQPLVNPLADDSRCPSSPAADRAMGRIDQGATRGRKSGGVFERTTDAVSRILVLRTFVRSTTSWVLVHRHGRVWFALEPLKSRRKGSGVLGSWHAHVAWMPDGVAVAIAVRPGITKDE